MDELSKNIAAIKEDISEIKATLRVNTKSLELHMVRTELNEKRIHRLEQVYIVFLGGLVIALLTRLI